MAADGSIVIDTKIQTDGFEKGATEIKKEFEKIADSTEDSQKAVEKAFDGIGDSAKDTGLDVDKGLTEPLEDVGDQASKTGKDIDKLKDPIEQIGKESDKYDVSLAHRQRVSFAAPKIQIPESGIWIFAFVEKIWSI